MEEFLTVRIAYIDCAEHLVMAMTSFRQTEGDIAPGDLDVKGVPMNSFVQILDALTERSVQAAFIPVPAAMHLFSNGLDIKLVMFGHRSGSVMVQQPSIQKLVDFKGKSILLPHELSIQAMLAHRLFAAAGITLGTADSPRADVTMEIVPPFLMPEMMAADDDHDIGGYLVSEPFGSQAVQAGHAALLCSSHHLFKNHPGSALLVYQDLVDSRPDFIRELTGQLFQSAKILENRQDKAYSALFQRFCPDITGSQDLLFSNSRVSYAPGLLVPDKSTLQTIQQYMVKKAGMLPDTVDIDNLVNDAFAATALQEDNS